MQISVWKSSRKSSKRSWILRASGLLIALAVLGLLLGSGCLFRKRKPPAAPALPAPVRIALLPLNVPQANADLRWMSFATIVTMGEIAQAAPDLEIVPVYESVQAALQSLGNSRMLTQDIAELVATRLSARWASNGEITAAGNSLTLLVDFVPSQSTRTPFRYQKPLPAEAIQSRLMEAFEQFLRYLIVRPVQADRLKLLDMKKLREIADALDAEYGWYGTPRPGASTKVVEDLAQSNPRLAKVLFSPTLYPVLAK
jgi:hypothetical protein